MCTCEAIDGIHTSECALYVAEEPQDEPVCTCEAIDGIHTSECALHEAPVVLLPPVTSTAPTQQANVEARTSTPTIAATVYTTYDSTNGFSGKVIDLTADGVTLSGDKAWPYKEKRYVQIHYSGLDPSATSTITVALDESLYFNPIPSDCTFKANTKIALNPSGSYLHDGSGTATFKITGSTEGSFMITLNYDTALWNRLANQPLRRDTSKPILAITLDSDGTTSSVNMTDVYTKTNYVAYKRTNVKFYRNSSSIVAGYDEDPVGSVYGAPEDTMLMELRGYNQDTEYNYRVFYDDLRIEIQLPSCVINGKTYYMEFEKLAPYDSSASLQYKTTIVEDKENGKLTIFYDNIYRTGYYPIGRVFLKFPQIAGLDKGKYTFTGAMRWYNGDTEIAHIRNETIDGKIVPRTTFSIVMDNAQAAELAYYSHDKTIGCCDHVAQMFLGNYTLVNKGSKASEKVTVQMTFNASGTARLGVASVMLMGDPNQRPMTVRYTLMDETGKVIDNNGQPFTVEVPHNYTTYAATVNHGVLFNRGMLPAEHQKYYFKSVEYDISSIPAGHNYNNQGDPMGLQKPGNFYGYYLGEHTTSGKTSNTICKVFDVNGDEKASLTDTVVTNVIERYRASMYINSCGFYKTEINAGESFYMDASAYIDSYPYGSHAAVDQVRFGVLLPDTAVINESSIEMMYGVTREKVELGSLKMIPKGNGRNLWIIECAPNQPIGYYTENVSRIENGDRIYAIFQVNTSTNAIEETLRTGDILTTTAAGLTNVQHTVVDKYDLNENGSKTDNVGYVLLGVADKTITIRARNAQLEDSEGFSSASGLKTSADIYSADEVVNYQVNIKNTKGGIAQDMAYYVQIPEDSLGAAATDRLVLAGAGTVNYKTGTKIKLLYTTDPGLNYTNVKSKDDADSIAWSETVSDYSKVTMVKAVTIDGTGLVNGSESSFTIPLKYGGTDYSRCAGATAKIRDYAVYTYDQGAKSISYEYPSDDSTVTLHYKAPEKVLTLTAALNMQPTAPNVRVDTYTTGLDFYKAQTFKVGNLKLNNVDLGNYTAEQLNADANRRFKIGITMNSGSQQVLLSDLSVGSLAANAALSFGFELFNGNALTDITTARYITFDLVSDHVTIPVRININRELAVAGATQSAIKAGKEYLDAGEAESISVSKNSAFTVQFVTPGLNDTNYGTRTLNFSSALPKGTTIALLDYTGATPRYASYTAPGSVENINLESFTLMGKRGGYTVNTGSDITERLLFVVDFSGADAYLADGTYTAKMTVAGNGVADAVSKELRFTTTSVRTFSAKVDKSALKYGESFAFTYTVGSAANDSKYEGRALALVITGSSLPADASLTAGGVSYYQNSRGEFIIPLTAAQTAGTKSLALQLESDTLVNNLQSCTLTGKLWIGATSNGEQPHLGDSVATVTVTYSAVTPPSLKVVSMSDRALTPEDLANAVTLTYTTADIPAGATVTLEVQKLIDAGYVTDTIYAEAVTANQGVDAGVYTVKTTGDTLTIKLSKLLEVGNYQMLMSVRSGDKVLLSVPYRFIVTE